MKIYKLARSWVGRFAMMAVMVGSFAVSVCKAVVHFVENALNYFKSAINLRTKVVDWQSLYRLNKSVSIEIKQYISEKLKFVPSEDFEHRNFA